METEINKVKTVRKYILILIICLLTFMVYYLFMSILSPVRKISSLQDEYGFKQDEKNKQDERLLTDSAYLKLLKDRSFLQSGIVLAETDSIYLTVNLADSSVHLEINGVTVHRTRIKKQSISKMLINGDEFVISSMVSRPMTILKSYSSIPREPLMIKMAPKDTTEFQPDIIPDTAAYEPVNYLLEMDNGTRLFVYQEEKLKPGDGIARFGFDLRYRIKECFAAVKRIMVFKVPEYHPFIKLRLPRADAKIIYRALPLHGQIALYR